MQKANFAFLFSGGLKKKADPLINFPLLTKSVTWDTVCEGKVWVGLHCGGEFQGRVEEGKREGDCRVTCLASGIRLLQASYYQVYVLGALLDIMRFLRTNLRVTPDWRRRMVVGGRASAWKGDGMAWSESSTAKKWSNSLAGVLFRF